MESTRPDMSLRGTASGVLHSGFIRWVLFPGVLGFVSLIIPGYMFFRSHQNFFSIIMLTGLTVGIIVSGIFRTLREFWIGLTSGQRNPSNQRDSTQPANATDTADSYDEPNSSTNATGSEELAPAAALRADAEEARKTAEAAKANYDFETAIDEYRGAINLYRTAVEELAVSESESREKLTEAIESTREELEATKTLSENQNDLTKILHPAYRSFQEAIVAYVEGNQTVTRIRFRQARDNFEDAVERIKGSEEDLFTSSVEVAAQSDRKLSSMALIDIPTISDPVAAKLSDAGIETVKDIDSSDEPPWIPPTVAELGDTESISDEVVTTLTLLSWWNNDDSYEVDTVEEVERWQQQADYGFNQAT